MPAAAIIQNPKKCEENASATNPANTTAKNAGKKRFSCSRSASATSKKSGGRLRRNTNEGRKFACRNTVATIRRNREMRIMG